MTTEELLKDAEKEADLLRKKVDILERELRYYEELWKNMKEGLETGGKLLSSRHA
jgi:deoxyadenosine/deoxycytidine kinase